MNEKIEIMGLSIDKCHTKEVMENINRNWGQEVLATYGMITMKLLMEARQDEELKEYIEALDKAVIDEPEVLRAAGMEDKQWENEISEHEFLGTLFWKLNTYKNAVFLLGETEEEAQKLYAYLKEQYPNIVITGKDSLEKEEQGFADRVINEINALCPQVVLSCSKNYGPERFVKQNRKMMNTKVWFSLGNSMESFRDPVPKMNWLNRLMEKNTFKKMVSKYNENVEKM